MIVYDKNLPHINNSKRFYRKLIDSRKSYDRNGHIIHSQKTCLYETEYLVDPIVDSPNELARFFKRFLADIGKQLTCMKYLVTKKKIK